jgi:hypothetical protein
LAHEETKNPQDIVDDHRQRVDEIVTAHFEQTEKVIFGLKVVQKVVLSELDVVKSKLEEGNMCTLRLREYECQEEQLKHQNELYVSKIESVERSKLEFIKTCEEKSAKLMIMNKQDVGNV